MVRPFRRVRCAARPGRRRHDARRSCAPSGPPSRSRRASRPGGWQPAPAARRSATSGGTCCTRSVRTAYGPTPRSPAKPSRGPFALVSRLAAEPRLTDDPEWPGRRDLTLLYRAPEAYLSAQFKYGNVFYGQMLRNWGPVGLAGHRSQRLCLPPGRVRLSRRRAELRARGLRALAQGRAGHARTPDPPLLLRPPRQRPPQRPPAGGALGDDRHLGHRSRVRWPLPESADAAPVHQSVRAGLRTGMSSSASMRPGASAAAPRCRHSSGSTICNTSTRRVRRAIPTAGRSRSRDSARSVARSRGARSTPRRRAWPSAPTTRPRTSPTPVSGSAATSTTWTRSPLTVSVPYRSRWLLTPELTLLRQGEGDINDPFPATDEEAGALPQLFIGVVERTWRAARGPPRPAGAAGPAPERRIPPRRQRGPRGGPHREPIRGPARRPRSASSRRGVLR